MRYSANLNIIVKAIEKAIIRTPRDFMELENLQSNVASANKFATACYNRIKEILAEDLHRFRPDYNIFFSDGQKIIAKPNAEYAYNVFPIDGFNNLAHSNPDFTVAIALEHIGENGQKEAISVAINKVIGNELYYCEKGFGAFLNNRRIRVSKRSISDSAIISLEDKNLLSKTFETRAYGCKSLDVSYLASSRIEAAVFKAENNEFLKPFLLLAKEAGGKIIENEKFIAATNGLIEL